MPDLQLNAVNILFECVPETKMDYYMVGVLDGLIEKNLLDG